MHGQASNGEEVVTRGSRRPLPHLGSGTWVPGCRWGEEVCRGGVCMDWHRHVCAGATLTARILSISLAQRHWRRLRAPTAEMRLLLQQKHARLFCTQAAAQSQTAPGSQQAPLALLPGQASRSCLTHVLGPWAVDDDPAS